MKNLLKHSRLELVLNYIPRVEGIIDNLKISEVIYTPKLLPEGYKLLEYIESDERRLYIDTLYIPNSRTCVDLEYQGLDTVSVYNFGCNNYAYGDKFEIGDARGVCIGYGRGGKVQIFPIHTRVKISNNINYFKIVSYDGEVKEYTFPESDINQINYISQTFLLFGWTELKKKMIGATRIWYLKIKENNLLLFDLIPAQNPEGINGMYDLVSGQFFSSETEDNFIAGPVINYEDPNTYLNTSDNSVYLTNKLEKFVLR